MQKNKGKKLNWGCERRCEFIEFRAFWPGLISRVDLMDAFRVSSPKVSLDLYAYIEQAKRNLVYYKSLRTYLRGKHFKPKYLKPDAEEYFALLRTVDQGPVTAKRSADEAWHTEIALVIGPHPDLSDNQRCAIEMDHGMEGGMAQIAAVRALLFYALKQLGLDTDPSVRRPRDQQIVLLNSSENLGVS